MITLKKAILLTTVINFIFITNIESQNDTLYFEGYDIVEKVDTGWVHLGVEYSPKVKFYQSTDSTGYIFFQIAQNKPIMDEKVTIIQNVFYGGIKTIGCISDNSGPFQIKVLVGSNQASFLFEADFKTETFKSMILMVTVRRREFYY